MPARLADVAMFEWLAGVFGAKQVAAAAGAGIAAARASHLPMHARITTFAGGFTAAIFLTDPACAWFKLPVEGRFDHGVAFIIGLFGMLLIELAFTTDWRAIISWKAGVKTGGDKPGGET